MPFTDPDKLRAKWKRQSAARWKDPQKRARQQAYIQEWRAAHPTYGKEWRAAHPGYQPGTPFDNRARQAVNTARRKGLIVRLDCEVCGSSDRVEAHHAFGYEPEMALAVWWLCRRDHAAMHVAIRRS